MTPTIIAVIISASAFILNLVILLIGLSYRAGVINTKILVIETRLGFLEGNVATKEEVGFLRDTLLEIKGMFHMELGGKQ